MRIAIPIDGENVSAHFGHCEHFVLVDVNSNKIEGKTTIANPGHRPGFLPGFLAQQGANYIIAGGLGAKAYQLFEEAGVKVITGARGSVDNVLAKFLQGQLESTGSICREHMHAGDCGGHHE